MEPVYNFIREVYNSFKKQEIIMLKGKKYDWKDSNMALFGSDTEKKVSKYTAH